MLCLGFEPGAARWKAKTDPLSFGGRPSINFVTCHLKVLNLTYVVLYLCPCWSRSRVMDFAEHTLVEE